MDPVRNAIQAINCEVAEICLIGGGRCEHQTR